MRQPRPPELDHVLVRLESTLAPIRTRIYRAQQRMATQRQRPGPGCDLLTHHRRLIAPGEREDGRD